MNKINDNFSLLRAGYLFPEIARRTSEFQKNNPKAALLRLGIGDVTRPIFPCVADAIKKAVDEQMDAETFRGYGPELGYGFLREAIAENVYGELGITAEEVFVSQGINEDIARFPMLFSTEAKVMVQDPVYPVYVDTSVMGGRSGNWSEEKAGYENIVYMPATEENGFDPVPTSNENGVTLIYICNPNNPTGTTLNKEQLKKWVDFANENNAVILYDAAYEAYITEENVPHSIFEVEGAKTCAVEFKSFSKDANFAGMRAAYCVVPKELIIEGHSMKDMWARLHQTSQNGLSYPMQRAAEAVLTEEGQKAVKENVGFYLGNTKIIREGLTKAGLKVYGGVNAPYVWVKVPEGYDSWSYFDYLLNKKGVVTVPGAGFGTSGEGYIRLSGFGSREATIAAVERIVDSEFRI